VRLTEEEIRALTLSAMEQLGERATPEAVKKIVSTSVSELEKRPEFERAENSSSGRIILTSFGMNAPGIVAAITTGLANLNCNIEDISQKLMGEYFTMIMVVDIGISGKELGEIQTEMNKIAEELKVKIYIQHEEIFNKMHRI